MIPLTHSPARAHAKPFIASHDQEQRSCATPKQRSASSATFEKLPTEVVDRVIDAIEYPRAILALMRTNKTVHQFVESRLKLGIEKGQRATKELMMLWRDDAYDEAFRQKGQAQAIGPVRMPLGDRYRELKKVIERHAFLATRVDFGPLFELPPIAELEGGYRNSYHQLPKPFSLQLSGPRVFIGSSSNLENISLRVPTGEKAGRILECFADAQLPRLQKLDLSGWPIDSHEFALLKKAQITTLRSLTCTGRGLITCYSDEFFDFLGQQKDLRHLKVNCRIDKSSLEHFLSRGHASLELMVFDDLTVLDRVSGPWGAGDMWPQLLRDEAEEIFSATRNRELFPQLSGCHILMYDSRWPAPPVLQVVLGTLALSSMCLLGCAHLTKQAVDGLLSAVWRPV